MVSWSSRRKAFIIFLFTFPTLLGLLVFNVFPIVLNTYISFTNRNKSHPNPDCEAGLSGYLIPNCWPVFRENLQQGRGEPYRIIEPWYKNYADLIGRLFTPGAVEAMLRLGVIFVPLIVAAVLDKRFDKQITRPAPSWVVWGVAFGVLALLAWIVRLGDAYAQLTDTGDFMVVVLRTILYVILRVPLTFVIALILALILNSQHLKGRTFFRVVLFIPWAASSMAILMALVFQFFFRDQGTINQILSIFELPTRTWLNQAWSAMAAIVITDIWFSYPFLMIIILGALQSVPLETYEAAEMDGANAWNRLMSITLPLIRPAVLPALVLTSITAFQIFGSAYAITGGGPIQGAGETGATEFVMVYAFKQVFQSGNYGRATAFAVIIFIFLFISTLMSLRITKITKGAYE